MHRAAIGSRLTSHDPPPHTHVPGCKLKIFVKVPTDQARRCGLLAVGRAGQGALAEVGRGDVLRPLVRLAARADIEMITLDAEGNLDALLLSVLAAGPGN